MFISFLLRWEGWVVMTVCDNYHAGTTPALQHRSPSTLTGTVLSITGKRELKLSKPFSR